MLWICDFFILFYCIFLCVSISPARSTRTKKKFIFLYKSTREVVQRLENKYKKREEMQALFYPRLMKIHSFFLPPKLFLMKNFRIDRDSFEKKNKRKKLSLVWKHFSLIILIYFHRLTFFSFSFFFAVDWKFEKNFLLLYLSYFLKTR